MLATLLVCREPSKITNIIDKTTRLALRNNSFQADSLHSFKHGCVFVLSCVLLSALGSHRRRDFGTDDQETLDRKVYDGVQTFLMFIGYPRSGHTLVSSLLDAHPNAIVANEFDVIGKWQQWDTTNKNKYFLFDQLYQNSKQEAEIGYRSASVPHRYNYSVPSQWQGTFNRRILVGFVNGSLLLFGIKHLSVAVSYDLAYKVSCPSKYFGAGMGVAVSITHLDFILKLKITVRCWDLYCKCARIY